MIHFSGSIGGSIQSIRPPADERTPLNKPQLEKAAVRGEATYVWRDGQTRRMRMVLEAAGERAAGWILDDGCGVGMYLDQFGRGSNHTFGLEYDAERAAEAAAHHERIVRAAGERLPYPNASFDLVLSHEVLEHVGDDRQSVQEIVRVLRRPDSHGNNGGRLALFLPNRGYPFETHGIVWRGRYRFGNIPLINYLPRGLRDRLAPHVRVYTRADVAHLFQDLPVQIVESTVIFGAYDNIIAR